MKVKLFCFPYAGASAMVYSRWRQKVPQWLEIRPVELPGRGTRLLEPLVTDTEQLIEQIVEELSADVLRQPYGLFGHSLGALLAFEAAHKLETLGLPQPLALFASGTNAPSRRNNDRFAGLQSDEQLRAEMYKLNGTHSEVFASDELMALTLPVLRADFQLCGQYRYRRRRPLNLPLHVFGGDRDETTLESLMAWQQETSADFSLDKFDGDHFFIQSHEIEVLQTISRYLQF